MRAFIFIMILVGVTNHVAVNAQAPDVGMGFSGIYAPPVFVDTIAVIEPEVYPFLNPRELHLVIYSVNIANNGQHKM